MYFPWSFRVFWSPTALRAAAGGGAPAAAAHAGVPGGGVRRAREAQVAEPHRGAGGRG